MKIETSSHLLILLRRWVMKTSGFFEKEISTHVLLVIIVLAATLLRIWQLDTHQIFFGDAAHDLLVAKSAIATHTLPLLGIPSSVPRFRQGPVAIWFEMLSLLVSNNSLFFVGSVFAVLSIVAIIVLYELLALFYSKRAATFAAVFLAFSPLAIANARTPYHTTPIPLFLALYLFCIMLLYKKQQHALFWSCLSFCLLFQFELALTPLVLLIPYVAWRNGELRRQKILDLRRYPRVLFTVLPAFIIGLAPQIVYDFTHHFAQLGGFGVWIIYRVAAFFGYRHDHTFSLPQLKNTLTTFWFYFARIWSAENTWLAVACALVFLAGFAIIIWQVAHRHKVPIVLEITVISSGLLFCADIVLGSASEAYFPPFFVLSAIILGFVMEQLWKFRQYGKYVAATFAILYAVVNTIGIVDHNFFVSTPAAFSYGPSISEQRQIVFIAKRLSHNHFQFATTREEGKFSSFFDNLRWVSEETNTKEDPQNGQVFFVEDKTSPLKTLPGITRYIFTTTDMYVQ